MKKLMIALLAIATGVVAQAATVDWQYKITGDTTKTANLYDGYTVYLVDSAKWAALEAVTPETFEDTSVVYGSTTFAAGSGKSSYAFQTKDAGGAKGAYATALDDSIVAEGGNLAVKYILVNGNVDPEKYLAVGDATLIGRGSSGEPIQSGFGTADTGDIQNGSWAPIGGESPVDTPEPTSGLLVLLGMAGLALRRKMK